MMGRFFLSFPASSRALGVSGAALMLGAAAFGAASPSSVTRSTAAWAPGDPLVVGSITIDSANVFESDPEIADRFPYSWADKIHIVSKERFVRSELLFREGDPFDPEVIAESERVLRQRPVFRYVSITPAEPTNGVVDVHVETRDVWTTSVQASYEQAGGETLYRLGLLEQNLLGHGIRAGGFIRQDIDRFIRGVTYYDPHFFRTPLEFFGGYGTDEKGREYEWRLARPFRSVLTRAAYGVETQVADDEGRLFDAGEEFARFRHKETNVRSHAAVAIAPSRRTVRRVSLIHDYQSDRFSDIRTGADLRFPDRRVISAALIGFDFRRIRYIERRGVTTFDRDEDLNLGFEGRVEAGPSLESLGATRDGAILRAAIDKISAYGERLYLFFHADASTRVESERTQNAVLRVRQHAVAKHWFRGHTATLSGEVRVGRRLDPEHQFLLGGETGLRAYSVREFGGNKSALFTLENRQVVLYDWLKLANVGWAVFADAGAVWKRGEAPSFATFRSDVGAGLRFAPSRSTDPGIVRLDLAYALNENDRRSRLVIHIGGEVLFGRTEERKFDF